MSRSKAAGLQDGRGAGLVLVVWTDRDEEVIRIISARWATGREEALFHAYLEERS